MGREGGRVIGDGGEQEWGEGGEGGVEREKRAKGRQQDASLLKNKTTEL